MNRIPVEKVTLRTMSAVPGEYGPEIAFSTLGEADNYTLAHPGTRYEFGVHWQDGTYQLGRVTGKAVSAWLADWANWMLTDPETLPAGAKADALRSVRLQNPALVAHAQLLKERLSTA
jgi:hypothetical protein